MKEKVRLGQARWDIAERGETVQVAADKEQRIRDEYLGCYFGLASFIMDLGIVDIDDLNMAVGIALDMRAPFTLMNDMGLDQAHALVEQFCLRHPGFGMPSSLERARSEGGGDSPTWSVRDAATSRS